MIHRRISFLRNTFLLLLILLFFQAAGYFVADLVTNSSLSLNLQNVSGLTFESGFGLFIIAILLFSLMLVSFKVFENIFNSKLLPGWQALSAIIVSLLAGIICWFEPPRLSSNEFHSI